MKDILDSPGLIILQIQDDFGLCNIQDAFAETASIQITDVLCGCHSRSTVATDDLENLLNPFASKRFRVVGIIGVIVSDQFPCLINEDCLLFGPVLFRLIPDIVKRHKHADRKKFAGQLRDVQDSIGIIQLDVRVLVEGFSGSVDQAIEDISHPLCLWGFHEDLIDITQERHLTVLLRMFRIDQ